MGKCVRNDVGSVVLNRHSGGGNFKLWSGFHGASFRRKIIETVSCGGGGFRHRQSTDVPKSEKPKEKCRSETTERNKPGGGSDKLSELLMMSEPEDEDVKKKEETLEELKRAVKLLQCDFENGDVLVGAAEVRRLAKEDSEARTTLALIGAIPPLVALLDSDDLHSQIAALYALLNLGIGNDANKAAIVKAGAVHKMLKLIESPDGSPNRAVAEAIVANFLGLSALDSNKPIIGSSDAIPFLVKILKDLDKTSSNQAKQDSLRALYNLSILPSNVLPMLETDLVRIVFSMLGDMEVSERILSVISNVVSTPEGRKAVSVVPDSFPILVDVLHWTDSPGCQEKATYILMVMAHKAYGDRQAMIEAGVVSSLLELTLLGSTLAQKRASRILEFLRVDKGKQVSENFAFGGGGLSTTVSAPLCGSTSSPAGDPNNQSREFAEQEDNMMSDEKKAVKHLVEQSLQNNMRRIVKRANLHQDFIPSDHFKSLTSSSTSKSLPF